MPQVISSNVILADKSGVNFHGSSKTTGATELLTSLTFQSAETAQEVFHSSVTVKRPETEELNKQIYMQIETEKVILTKGNEKRPCTGTNIYICSIIVSDQVQ